MMPSGTADMEARAEEPPEEGPPVSAAAMLLVRLLREEGSAQEIKDEEKS